MARYYANLGNFAPTWRLAVLSAFSLVAWLALRDSAAIAGCGDYVKVANPQFAEASHGASLMPESANRAPLPLTPCSGPQCRGNVPAPAAPPPVVVRTLVEQLAILITLADAAQSEPSVALSESGAHPEAGYRALLERPPRG